jgi:glycosyltransferase involved in cell wall biosynthesis
MAMLAICIPTFNRAAQLKVNLENLANLLLRYDIDVHVSDNSSTDDTGMVVASFMERCPRIFYHRNDTNVGMDGNFAVALGLADTPYVWLLGDDDLVSEATLGGILDLLADETYDLVLLNGGHPDPDRGRAQNEPSRDFDDPERLLVELGWHATWISGLVIGRRLRGVMDVRAYDGTYFSHFIALFGGLAAIDRPRVRWHAPSSFHPSHLAAFSWTRRVIEIFATRWSQAVQAIPGPYSAEARQMCIRAHGVRTGLLTTVGLLNLRAKNGLDLVEARRHRNALRQCSPCLWPLIVAIAATPQSWLGAVRGLALRLHRPRTSEDISAPVPEAGNAPAVFRFGKRPSIG